MPDLYQKTALTPMRAARLSGYIDWASQPSLFKHYPKFLFRYPFGTNPALRTVELARAITSRAIVGGKPYFRLNTPSAGNLHPIELYVQIRGVKGVLSGIYHVDAGEEALVLIREIERDGIEHELGMEERFEGMLFIVSCVPFRSEWKYGGRAVRYCYLDAGHQIGAVAAAAVAGGQDATILSGFDANCLNAKMGFSQQEFSCAVLAAGKAGERAVQEMRGSLMQVAPTDYCDTKGEIPRQIAEQGLFKGALMSGASDIDAQVIAARRSARHFSGASLPKGPFEHFMHLLGDAPEPLVCYSVVLRSETAAPGIYAGGVLVREGLCDEEISALLVDQRFVKEAAVVAVMTSRSFGSDALMAAGAFGHRLHLEAESRGAGFTGIGAFYDHKLQRFLGTEDYILYVCAVGVEKKQENCRHEC
jgi:SagB-type dehydrogenase family enzyme